jgi:uncharacterized membrane protein YGL010W
VFSSFWVLWYVLSCVYTVCDKPTGFVTSFSMFLMKILTYKLYNLDKYNKILGGYSFHVWITIHILCWTIQFVGHGVYEKRAPALLTNVFFIFLSPFFTCVEYLNLVFGYKENEIQELKKIV